MAKNQSFNLSLKLITAQFSRALSGVTKQIKAFGNYIKGAFAITGVTAFLKSLVNIGGEYENQMARVRAVANATEAEFKMLEKVTQDIGKNTHYSALEAAQGLEILTRNGLSAADAANVLTPALNLAAANSISLAQAGDIVTNVLNMFNKTTAESNTVADKFSYAAAHSATDVLNLYEAFKNAGPAAAAMGIDLDEVTATLMVFANQGIKGSDAGSKLAQILSKFSTDKAQGKLRQYGIEIDSTTLKSKGLYDAIAQLSDANLTPEQLVEIFGERAWRGVATVAKQVNEFRDDLDELGSASNTSTRMAVQGIGSWKQASAELQNAWQVAMTRMFNALKPIIVGVTNMTKGVLNWISSIPGVIALAFSAISATIGRAVKRAKAEEEELRASAGALAQAEKILNEVITEGNFKTGEYVKRLDALRASEIAAGRSATYLSAALTAVTTAEKDYIAKGQISARTNATLTTTLNKVSAASNRAAGSVAAANASTKVFNTVGNGLVKVGKGILSFFGGWVGLAITVASVVGSVLFNSLKKAKDQMVDLTKIHSEAAKQAGAEEQKVRALKSVVDDSTNSYSVREAAIKKLQQIIPGYIASIDKETGKLKEGKVTVDQYCESLINEAEMQLLAGKAAETKMLMETAAAKLAEELAQDTGPNFWDNLISAMTRSEKVWVNSTEGIITAEDIHTARMDKKKKAVKELQDSYDRLMEKMTELAKKTATTDLNGGGGGGGNDGGDDEDDTKARAKATKAYQDAIENLTKVRQESEKAYNAALKEGRSEEEARQEEILSEEEYLKKLIDATETYITALQSLSNVTDEDIQAMRNASKWIKDKADRYKYLTETLKENKKQEEEVAKANKKRLEDLQDDLASVTEKEKQEEARRQRLSNWDYFSTDPKEYRKLVVDLARAEDELAAAENQLSTFSKKDIDAQRQRIAELEALRSTIGLTKQQEDEYAQSLAIVSKYDELIKKNQELIGVVDDYRNELNSLQAADALKGLKEDTFKTAYNGIKQVTSGLEELSDMFEKISSGEGLDFFDVINGLFSVIDTIMGVIETFKTLKEMFTAVKLAQETMAAASVANAATEAAAETGKAAAVTTAQAEMATATTIAQTEMATATVAAQSVAQAAYHATMVAATTAAHAAEGWAGVADAAANIAAFEALIASATAAGSAIAAFADGGILGGHSPSGDKLLFRGNSGEMILNGAQQRRLFNIANGATPNGGNQVEFVISGRNLIGAINNNNKLRSRISSKL